MITVSQLAPTNHQPSAALSLADYHGPWKLLCRGGYWLFDEPNHSYWTWRMLGESLAQINRYDGATVTPYTVAQHSVLAHDYAPPELRLHALLHDAHEMVIGDKTAPVKQTERWRRKLIIEDGRNSLANLGAVDRQRLNYFISEIEEMNKAIEWQIDGVIFARAGLRHPTLEEQTIIKQVDMRMLATEMRDLCTPPPPGLTLDFGGATPYPQRIKALNWHKAADAFLDRLSNYVKV